MPDRRADLSETEQIEDLTERLEASTSDSAALRRIISEMSARMHTIINENSAMRTALLTAGITEITLEETAP